MILTQESVIDSFALEFVTKFFLLQFRISDDSSLLWDFGTPKLSSHEVIDRRRNAQWHLLNMEI